MKTPRWPRTLAARLTLIFLVSLVVAHGLSFGLQFYERYQSAMTMMLGNLEQDLTTSVAVLERLPADERAAWLPRFEHPNYRYQLDEGQPGTSEQNDNGGPRDRKPRTDDGGRVWSCSDLEPENRQYQHGR